MKNDGVKTSKPSGKLVLTKETLHVFTGIRAGSGSATRESNLPRTVRLTRDVDPQDEP